VIRLYPFQDEDVTKAREVRNVLIGNEMGTGKTYEALALDALRFIQSIRHTNGKTLVVARLTALVNVWEKKIHELTNLDVVRVDPKDRVGSWKRFLDSDADVFLVHWDVLRLMPELREIVWLHIIADECHRAKDRKAQQTQALKKLSGQYLTAMSGTIIDKPYEFWSILNWLYPKEFPSYWSFFKRYTNFEITYQ
jgi:SNF2 family DNA or RNA helicase